MKPATSRAKVPERAGDIPSLADFDAAIPLALADASIVAIAAWNRHVIDHPIPISKTRQRTINASYRTHPAARFDLSDDDLIRLYDEKI